VAQAGSLLRRRLAVGRADTIPQSIAPTERADHSSTQRRLPIPLSRKHSIEQETTERTERESQGVLGLPTTSNDVHQMVNHRPRPENRIRTPKSFVFSVRACSDCMIPAQWDSWLHRHFSGSALLEHCVLVRRVVPMELKPGRAGGRRSGTRVRRRPESFERGK
jgi:hypothetical protein